MQVRKERGKKEMCSKREGQSKKRTIGSKLHTPREGKISHAKLSTTLASPKVQVRKAHIKQVPQKGKS